MKQAYRRAMEHIRLSPPARENIQSALERPRHRRRLERPALIAVAAAVVLTVSAAAAAMQMVFFHNLPEDVAETMQPVNRSITRSGITLTVQSASIADGKFQAYVTMKDEEGGRLSKEGFDISFFKLSVIKGKAGPAVDLTSSDKYPFDREIWPVTETGPIDYDEESGTYGFLMEVRDKFGKEMPFPYQTFRLEVNGIYAGRIDGDASFAVDWPDASQKAETTHVAAFNLISGDIPLKVYSYADNSYTVLDDGADLLAPQEDVLEVMENYDISAIGWLDGRLHVQERFSGRKNGPDTAWYYTHPNGRMFLTRPDGTRVEPVLFYSYRSENALTDYVEIAYDISPEELAGCTLAGEYQYGGEYIGGDWSVDFSLEDPE